MSAAQDGNASPAQWEPESGADWVEDGDWMMDSLMDALADPTVRLVPSSFDPADPPDDLEEKTRLYSVLRALRQKVHQTGKNQQAVCAAWHAEPCLRRLCAEFEDPIAGFRITEDGFIVAEINFPEEAGSEGKIAFGPQGTVSYKIGGRAKSNRGWAEGATAEGWVVTAGVEDALRDHGLPTRR